MSVRNVPTLICDGCGSVIDMDFYLRIRPAHQTVVQKDLSLSTERHFCCEACQSWWFAQFPEDGPWGPAWDERDWWCKEVGDCGERARVRTAHDVMPLVDVHAHYDDPEHL